MWLRVRYLPKWKHSPRAVPGESCWLPSARLPYSSPEGVEEVTRARQEGQDVTVNPARITLYWIPISSKKSVPGEVFTADPRSGKPERHVGKLFNGEIDCLVSDHSPCPPEIKPATSWKHGAVLPVCKTVWSDVR